MTAPATTRPARRTLAAAGAAAALLIAGAAQADAACLKPGTVTVEQRGERSLKVSWKAPSGVRRTVAYRVTRAGRVVGQTRSRSMVVAVTPGRWVSLRIGVVEGRAARMRCAIALRARAEVRDRASLRAPGVLTVTEVSDREVRLRWRPVPRAAGYRVFRDGLVVKQVRRGTLDVPVVGGRPHRFQVAAVDRAGRVGAMSRLVVVATELSPPRPPTGLTATPAGNGAYRVVWRPAVPGSFPVRGYRVHRDGQVLGQGTETSRVVTGLQPGLTHRIEVQTVDSTGELSPKSVPLEISLDPPTPSTGTGRAFLLASTDRSFEDFQRNYMKIGRVYPTYFDCLADGTFVGRDDPRITRWAQARRIQVLARVNCQRTSTLNRILNEPVLRERWLSRIVEVARDHGYEGINIDFEAGLWTDRNALSDFVTELSARLRAEGRIVSICVSAKAHDNNKQHPRNGIFDYPVISAQVDEVLVMSWGWHWLTSPHGPISPLSWLTGVAQYTSSMPHRDRFVMGSPMYGIDWPQGSGSSNPGTALEYDQIQALIARVGATPQRDPASGELYFSYISGGIQRNVRYMDAESLRIKHATAAAAGIPRTFLWRMGNEDQAIWNLPSVSG